MVHRKSFLIKSSSFPHERALIECLAEVIQHRFALINHLRNARRLVIVTDFSGSETKQTLTTGLLVTSFDDLMAWHHSHRAAWRLAERFEGRSVGHKKVRDSSEGDLHRLNRILRDASNLTGMLVTTSVPADPEFIIPKGPTSRLTS